MSYDTLEGVRVVEVSMYAFVRVKTDELPGFDDQAFALDLLEQKHVLLAPGASFNVPYRDHFRTTLLPEAALLKKVFARIDELLASYAARAAELAPSVQREAGAEAAAAIIAELVGAPFSAVDREAAVTLSLSASTPALAGAVAAARH